MAAADYVWDGSESTAWSNPDNWDLGDGSYPGEEAGDTASFNAGAVDCVVDAGAGNTASGNLAAVSTAIGWSGTLDINGNEIQCTTFTASVIGNETIDINGGTLDVDDICDLSGATVTDTATGGQIECEGNFIIDSVLPATLTITLNGTGTLANGVATNPALLVVDTGAVVTVAAGDQYWGGYTYTAGTFNTFANSATLHMAVSGNISWDSNEASWIKFFEIDAGVTATMTDHIEIRSLTGIAGTTLTGATKQLRFLNPESTPWNFAGTYSGSTVILDSTSSDNIGPLAIDTGGASISISRGTWTATANINLGATGDLSLAASSGNASIDMVAKNLTARDIIINGGANDATMDLGTGSHIVTGDIRDGAGASGTTTLDVGTPTVALTGNFEGDSITMAGSAAGGLPATFNGVGSSATIQNVDMSGLAHIDARGIDGNSVADGGGNDNVRFARGLIGSGIS